MQLALEVSLPVIGAIFVCAVLWLRRSTHNRNFDEELAQLLASTPISEPHPHGPQAADPDDKGLRDGGGTDQNGG